ncbi:hypothetical protein SAMN05216232_3668 [Virgibacillus subterraneus]|uniref:Uncharacterized protein n=2 Tax=Virgibacillus TaxID=84406 RepID=A0A1H1DMR3_9BACI|nr:MULTISPECIES: hypothetical protein [Virgibacillus]SDQ77690.1 hypothetical protein SAMN05216231_2487 [Virgibacillus salinus]SEQ91016.1 hypothetical protein SAMN05216232_3668 [Virgibacillus subterraneus]
MNWPVLRDLKSMIGFSISKILGVIAIVLAANSNNYWVLFVVALSVMFISVARADKIYKQNL